MTRPVASRAVAVVLICAAVFGCENPGNGEAGSTQAGAATRATSPARAPVEAAGSTSVQAGVDAPATSSAGAATQPRELLRDAPPSGRPRPGAAPAAASKKPPEKSPAPAADAKPAEHYTLRPGSPDGIGKWYMGREIAHVMGHEGAGWLERAEREDEERPSKLIEILKKRIQPDDVFADIGAGTGYYSFRVAPLVPKGKVLAVDIQQEMLDLMGQLAKDKQVTNVEPVLGTFNDPKLPDGGVDWVLMVDAYHEFDHPREMMEALVEDLKPGGQIVLLEFRAEDPTVNIKPLHKMTEAQAVKEMTAVGLKHVETLKDLPWQHVMFFEKPAAQ